MTTLICASYKQNGDEDQSTGEVNNDVKEMLQPCTIYLACRQHNSHQCCQINKYRQDNIIDGTTTFSFMGGIYQWPHNTEMSLTYFFQCHTEAKVTIYSI